MRIRVPFDQIESVHVRLNEIDNVLANNSSTLKKAWSSITLESQAKNRINAMLGQSNSLAGKIQATDLEMSRYLQRVIRDFLEADSRSESITNNMFSSILKLSRDRAVNFQDRSLGFRSMYAALGILVPVAILYPAITALGWINAIVNTRVSTIPGHSTAYDKPKDKQTAEELEVSNVYELRQAEENRMSEEQTGSILPEFVYDNAGYGDNGRTYTFSTPNGDVGSVYVWNTKDVSLSCTYYTLKKLRDRGLGYPFKDLNGASGARWFDNCTDDVVKIQGPSALEEIINSYELPVKNVVVSFPMNPSRGGGRTNIGHVLLIDEIGVDGKITFSDNWPQINDINGGNTPITRTLDEFVKSYQKHNGLMVGAVIIGEPQQRQ